MKRLVSVIALLLCFAAFLSGCNANQDPNAPEGYKCVSAEEADYFLYVPNEWIEGIGNLSTSAYYSRGADATSISVTAFGAKLAGETVDTWWESYKEEFSAEFENFEVVSTEDAQLGGIDGKKFTFTATKGTSEVETTAEGETTEGKVSKQYNFVCVAVVKDTYVYYLLYTSTPEYYEAHLDTLSNVVSYFKFK